MNVKATASTHFSKNIGVILLALALIMLPFALSAAGTAWVRIAEQWLGTPRAAAG